MKKPTTESIKEGAAIRAALESSGLKKIYIASLCWPNATRTDKHNRLRLVLKGEYTSVKVLAVLKQLNISI